jgi:hypothetical protein
VGYSIYIGEAMIEYWPEDGHMRIGVEPAEHPDAPDLGTGDISGHSNGRHPSYTSMHNFCKDTDLADVFYDEEERTLKGGHPGATPLTWDMYERVKNTLNKWKADHPNAIAPNPENTAHLENSLDYTLGKLMWYEFWMRWALENCKMPTIANS